MKKFFGWVGVFVIMASFLVNVQSTRAADGDVALDTTFNTTGYDYFDPGIWQADDDRGYAVEVQSDGKYMVLGRIEDGVNDYGIILLRYNTDGSLDTTFDSDGYVIFSSSGDDYAEDMKIQSDGKYLVTGSTYNGNSMVLIRYNTNGSLDTTFSGDGYLEWDILNRGYRGKSIAVQSDGKIIVAGWGEHVNPGYEDMRMWRYNSDGTADTSFGSSGRVYSYRPGGGTGDTFGEEVQIQSDGKILVTGYTETTSSDFDMVVWRYTSSGALDTTFNTTGYYIFDSGNGSDYGRSMQVQSDGKYVITGTMRDSRPYNSLAIWRLTSSGALDTTFNTTGYVAYYDAVDIKAAFGRSIKVQSDGKYLIAGNSYNHDAIQKNYMTIFRFDTDGSIDTTFNSDGFVIGAQSANAESILIQPGGKYVAVGYVPSGGNDIAIWRYLEEGVPLPSTPTSLKNTLDNSAPGELVNMTIEYTPELTTAVTDGSVKLTLADEFDFTGISKADVSASGGGVTWSTNEIITVDGSVIAKNNSWIDKAYAQGEDSIVFGFTGDLSNAGGTITFTINGASAPLNPGTLGSYDFNVGVFSTSNGTGAALEVRDGKVAIVSQVNVSATVPSSLTFAIDGVTAGNACANSGGNADITTTSTTVPFGIYTGAETKIGCQTLTVSTNATSGFVVTMEQDQDLTSAGSDTMKKYSGIYATPTTWASPPGSGTESYFGFTTDDTDYSVFQTSKYSNVAANETPYSIMTEDGPVSSEVNVVSYQLEVTGLQEAGTYSNTVMYIATATF